MLWLTVLGFFTAVLANMTGIEGGIIFVPLFVLLLGLSPQEAAGVSMLTMIFGLGSGSLAYAVQKRIDFKLSLVLLAVSLPGTVIGALLTPYVPAKLLEALLILFLLPIGFLMLIRRIHGKASVGTVEPTNGWRRSLTDRGGIEFRYCVRHVIAGLIIFIFVGIFAGLLGIGGGALRLPALVLLLQVPVYIAVATSVFMMAVTALVGGFTHAFLGQVRLNYVLYLVPGVLVGSQLGAWLAKKTPALFLTRLLGGVVVLTGIAILAKVVGLF